MYLLSLVTLAELGANGYCVKRKLITILPNLTKELPNLTLIDSHLNAMPCQLKKMTIIYHNDSEKSKSYETKKISLHKFSFYLLIILWPARTFPLPRKKNPITIHGPFWHIYPYRPRTWRIHSGSKIIKLFSFSTLMGMKYFLVIIQSLAFK